MKKFECNGCTEHCVIYRADGGTPTRCVDCDDWADWHEAKEEETVTDCNQLPKLTTEIFDRPDCPKNVRYAVVTSEGRVVGYTSKPYINTFYNMHNELTRCWGFDTGCSFTIAIAGTFDASDWQNSLIERPAKTPPEGCTVGAICYDYGAAHYFEVTEIDDEKSEVSISWYPKGLIEVISYSLFTEYAKPARQRQFNEQEMLDLVGKVLGAPDGDWRSLIFWASSDEVSTYHRNYDACTLMDYTIDGKPGSKLEHLNDKGEWVE